MLLLQTVSSNACTCENGFQHVDKMPNCDCYMIFGFSDQPTAEKNCKSVRAVLAVPETLSEVAALQTYVTSIFENGANREIWLGYIKQGGIFVNPLTGEEMPADIWGKYQPDNKYGEQFCTQIPYLNNRENVPAVDDVDCSGDKRLAVCQKSCCTE